MQLDFRLGWREVSRNAKRLETLYSMVAVAERLIFRVAAAAEADGGTSAEAKRIAVGVDHGEVPFNSNGTIVEYCDFCCHGSIVADTRRRTSLAIMGE